MIPADSRPGDPGERADPPDPLPARLLRAGYGAAMAAARPLLLRKLRRRATAEPGYAEHVPERFGRYGAAQRAWRDAANTHVVWLHAVSLGETRAAAVLVDALRERLPGMRLLLTCGTATGRAEGQRLLRPGDLQVWQPWDAPQPVARFLDTFHPDLGLLMETEVWPLLAAACRARGVPLALANARLSEKSLRAAERLGALARPAYRALAAAWAQGADDAARLARLGTPVVGVFGNLKFDLLPDAAQRTRGAAWAAAACKPVLLLASSREGEEAQWLQAWKGLQDSLSNRPPAGANPGLAAIDSIAGMGDVQWLIVPRHPQRFDAVAALLADAGCPVRRRSAWGDAPPHAEGGSVVWLGDSLGEMALYYALARAALLGGSFAPFGGQNLIEAAACGCPVVVGPSTFNFADAVRDAVAAGAALPAPDLPAAVACALRLAHDATARAAASAAGEAFARQHRGAAARTADAAVALLRHGTTLQQQQQQQPAGGQGGAA